MKILRISKTYPNEGNPGVGLPDYYYANYSKDDNLIITEKTKSKKLPSNPNVRIVEVPMKPYQGLGESDTDLFGRMFLFLKSLWIQACFFMKGRKYVDEYKPDIIHASSPLPILFGVYGKIKYKSKIILSLHGTDVRRISSNKLYALLLRIPDAVVAVNYSAMEELKNCNMKRPIQYIGNGYEKEIFMNLNAERRKQFVNVAGLRPVKGQKYLLEAFKQFYLFHKDYKLVLVGGGEDKDKLLKQVQELEIEAAVSFVGICDRKRVAEILNESQAMILPSLLEGFPKAVIESMATGTPVIASDVGDVKRIIKDSGYIVPIREADSIYRAMNLIIDKNTWKILSERAEEYAKEYSWEKVNERFQRVIDNLVKS